MNDCPWKVYNEDCLDTLEFMLDASVDLTVTSPPYDNLRTYNGYCFNFEEVARELYRVTKTGGVVVWNVGDAVVDGSETGTSFRQALYFKEIGFRLHDTMIWRKTDFKPKTHNRYEQEFEFMFILSKGKPSKFNGIRDKKNKHAGHVMTGTVREADGTTRAMSGAQSKVIAEFGLRGNVWDIQPVKGGNGHPAPFPEVLARDHIISWSDHGDLVFDPFTGSGTTGKVARELGRRFIGADISKDYAEMARRRIAESVAANDEEL